METIPGYAASDGGRLRHRAISSSVRHLQPLQKWKENPIEVSHWHRLLSAPCSLRQLLHLLLVSLTTIVLYSFIHQQYIDRINVGLEQPKQLQRQQRQELGAIVLLAPQRHLVSMWNIDRFCFLLRVVRSIDQYLNSIHGPYPIHVLVSKDYTMDPRRQDGPYSSQDRQLVQQWAPNSTIIFHEIDLYSGLDALGDLSHAINSLKTNLSFDTSAAAAPAAVTARDLILKWRQGYDDSVPGRDLGYTSMCRLWSGRLQQMDFLNHYEYYLRMDDDSLLVESAPYDPFIRMKERNLTYAYRRNSFDRWGSDKLWEIARPHVEKYLHDANYSDRYRIPFLTRSNNYFGDQPYNNFHVSKVSFWKSSSWLALWNDLNDQHAFFKYRVGDANVHAIAMMMMPKQEWEIWPDMPYVHNSNDMTSGWGHKTWQEECQNAYMNTKKEIKLN